MADPPVDLDQVERILDSQPEVLNARLEAKRRELRYRGAGATIMAVVGAVIVVVAVIYWILMLAGVV